MGTVDLRGSTWRAKVRKRGQNIGRSFDTKTEAQACIDRTEARIESGAKADQIANTPPSLTVARLFDRYATEVAPEKPGGRWEIVRLTAFQRLPEFQALATNIDGADLAAWHDKRLKTVKSSTVNRDLNLISAVFSRAIFEWRLHLTKNPVGDMKRPPQPKHRERRVSDEERAVIIKEFGWGEKSAPAELNEWVAGESLECLM